MFTPTDFLNLISFLQGKTITPTIDKNIQTLVQSEKATSQDFFTQTIDTPPFQSDDYKRLKNMLIDWYSSHKTVIGVQKNVSDPFSLPDVDLNELIISFGFNIPESFKYIPFYNKTEFFLNLVNLYKIKGTPEDIIKLLGFFGISNVDLIEYWLKKDTSGNLVFHGKSLAELLSLDSRSINLEFQDIAYNELTLNDPHWFLTESQIYSMFENNKIRFPSKSPYFSVRPTMYINEMEEIMSYLINFCQGEYNTWISTGTLDRTITLSGLNIIASVLELYVSLCYAFDSVYSRYKTSNNDNIIYYNGTSVLHTDIFTEYKELTGDRNLLPADVSTSRVLTQLDRTNNLNIFDQDFTIPNSNYFLSDSTAGYLLNVLNPSLKVAIDSYLTSANNKEVVQNLVQDMGSWLGKTIGLNYTNFSYFIMGLQNLTYLTKVLNFFKPYRARLILSESVLVQNNPLADSIIAEDKLAHVNETDVIVDFDTADSKPGLKLTGGAFSPSPTNYITSIQLTRYYPIISLYLDSTKTLRINYEDDTSYSNSNFVYSNPGIGEYRITNFYLYVDPLTSSQELIISYDDEPISVIGTLTNITSDPPSADDLSTFVIKNIYLDSSGNIKVDYFDHVNMYYSRNTLDTGSYFDLGASCDNENPVLEITIKTIDKYNYHSCDSIYDTGSGYTLDEGGNVSTCYQYGGFINLDEGGVFDAPFASEVVMVTVHQ